MDKLREKGVEYLEKELSDKNESKGEAQLGGERIPVSGRDD